MLLWLVRNLFYLKSFSKRQVAIACLFWFLLIAVLCGMPGKDIPYVSWFDLLSVDKWVHTFIFFVLASWGLELALRFSINAFIILITCIVYGGILEILQQLLFIDRAADWLDFAANTTGVIVGWFLYQSKHI
ncbi:MAG: VanZ family protein [Bacteroidia bacterium]|nr:VanZ family protein [Bacteroidia bacterium]